MQRAAVDADIAPLEAGRVGEASAGGDDKVLQVHGIGAGEPASDLRPRFQTLSWDDATRPLPGEPHALPETPAARLVCRSTRWRESIPP